MLNHYFHVRALILNVELLPHLLLLCFSSVWRGLELILEQTTPINICVLRGFIKTKKKNLPFQTFSLQCFGTTLRSGVTRHHRRTRSSLLARRQGPSICGERRKPERREISKRKRESSSVSERRRKKEKLN